jgi:N-glycosylase/DNA lyase
MYEYRLWLTVIIPALHLLPFLSSQAFILATGNTKSRSRSSTFKEIRAHHVQMAKTPNCNQRSSSSSSRVAKSSRKSPARKKKQGASPTRTRKSKSDDIPTHIYSYDVAQIAPENDWVDLNVPPDELRPSATLTTGQCFSWLVVQDECSDSSSNKQQQQQSAWGVHDAKEWIGPLGNRCLSIRETATTTMYRVLAGPTDGVDEYLRDYFQLDVPLAPLYEEWSRHDKRLARIGKVIRGVRILRQDPVECLFSFICSSNNNVPRITKMLAAFRSTFGEFLMEIPCRSAMDDSPRLDVPVGRKLYSFPTLEALQAATDPALREMGLGYRASYIIATIDLLLRCGGEEYLLSLREQGPDFVQEKLCELKGVGRKVADCVALFSLNQAEAIPIDTHVWHIACREYDPSLSEVKSLTPTVYKRCGELFRSRFPSHAGWAHSLLFVAELPSFRGVLPLDIVTQMDEWKEQEKAKKAADKEAKASKNIIKS